MRKNKKTVYDGIHYDAMAVANPNKPEDENADVTMFDNADVAVELKMRHFLGDMHAHRAYTDTAGFRLRCLVCETLLKGEKNATEHVSETGHASFAEIEK